MPRRGCGLRCQGYYSCNDKKEVVCASVSVGRIGVEIGRKVYSMLLDGNSVHMRVKR